jgi:hypothetical protein
MPFDLGKMIHRDTTRRTGKETMVVPVHETVDNQYQWHKVQPVLEKCADQIVASGLVWKWCRFSGRHVLVRLSENRTFVGFDIQDCELNRTVASLKEAKAIAEEWHRIRYDDNEQEWQDSGGSTREAEEQMEAEAERHIGVFKCVGCGEAITDPYIIEGDLALTRSASARKRPTRSSIAGTSRPAIVKISFQR